MLTSVEVCAGAGGSALGLEQAGFYHQALIEIDAHACATLRLNRPQWNVLEQDLALFKGSEFRGVDLLSGGVPCPPFSVAGKQLGEADERDLFPEMLRLAEALEPSAVLIENVKGILTERFGAYRAQVDHRLSELGFVPEWRLLQSSDYGVPQLRPRVVMVALRPVALSAFEWPQASDYPAPTVGEVLRQAMAEGGWPGVDSWAEQADRIAPTLVGGSKKHGGPDLGPTRAKQAWAELGVNAKTLAEAPPGPDHDGMPRLTVSMAALLQGFPPDWLFSGRKTNAYRQVGNAFPPPVAKAVGEQIYRALRLASAGPRHGQLELAVS
ncbi:MAG: DNA cytosine methyltransferase [Acidimicrobiia bacterium]|jgi:DNA (cytosine-5)-methyltransferase 1